MVGRRPKPTALKKLEGNPGKRKLNEREPKFEGRATCPKDLDPLAKKEWRRVCRQLEEKNLLTTVDRNSLAAYCICWFHAQKAEEDVASSPDTRLSSLALIPKEFVMWLESRRIPPFRWSPTCSL